MITRSYFSAKLSWAKLKYFPATKTVHFSANIKLNGINLQSVSRDSVSMIYKSISIVIDSKTTLKKIWIFFFPK